jgi:hypothetical protein
MYSTVALIFTAGFSKEASMAEMKSLASGRSSILVTFARTSLKVEIAFSFCASAPVVAFMLTFMSLLGVALSAEGSSCLPMTEGLSIKFQIRIKAASNTNKPKPTNKINLVCEESPHF